MKIGIMQPYFFPYIGYFSLMNAMDEFILFDTVQFIRHGWIERNRILSPVDGWQYVAVPLERHSRSTQISAIRINNNLAWKTKLLRQLEHYKKRAPHYESTIRIITNALEINTDNIVNLNKHILETICLYLGIDTKISVYSSMNLKIANVTSPDEWALNICNAVGNVDEYWNPEGGLEFFDCKKYLDKGINIKFLKMRDVPYSQFRPTYESFLSIIDVLMFNSVDEIRVMLGEYDLI